MHPYQAVGETGESQWELYLRAGRAVQNLLKNPPGRYLVVSHGGILNLAFYAILGIAPQANFTGPRFRFANTAYATPTIAQMSINGGAGCQRPRHRKKITRCYTALTPRIGGKRQDTYGKVDRR
jgi:broad specificity phosphatase PhoE